MKIIRRKTRGQGMVEYALILVLVALAVVIAAGLLGIGIQRVYGLVVAELGTKKDQEGDRYIRFEETSCYVYTGSKLTGLYFMGYTNYPLSELVGSTDRFMDTTYTGTKFYFDEAQDKDNNNPIPGSFAFNPLIAETADAGLCPRAVVIQTKDGSGIAVAPVEIIVENK